MNTLLFSSHPDSLGERCWVDFTDEQGRHFQGWVDRDPNQQPSGNWIVWAFTLFVLACLILMSLPNPA